MTEHAFSGSIPENYQRYCVPLLFEEYARELATGLEPTGPRSILETACGTGVVTRELARQLGHDETLVATDVNEAMLAAAQQELSNQRAAEHIEWAPADATELSFADDNFDAVICQFGVMFYPDRQRGYTEARRVLRPGGHFRFNTWDAMESNALVQQAHQILSAMFPDDPPRFLEIPFGYSDAELIERELRSAGFGDVTIRISTRPCRAPSAREPAMAFAAGSPLADQLSERGDLPQIIERLRHELEQTFGAGPIETSMQALVVDARP